MSTTRVGDPENTPFSCQISDSNIVNLFAPGGLTRPRVVREGAHLLCRAQEVRPGSAAELAEQAGRHSAALGGLVGVRGNCADTYGVRRGPEFEERQEADAFRLRS